MTDPGHSPQDGSIILDTPEQLVLFRLLQMKYSLRLEIRTGMRHSRGSVLNLVNRTLMDAHKINRPFTTKAKALEALEAYIDEKAAPLLDDPA